MIPKSGNRFSEKIMLKRKIAGLLQKINEKTNDDGNG